MKRKRNDYDEDDKLLHQATKALTKEAKRVKTFILQQALRKHRALVAKKSGAEGGGGEGSGRASSDEGHTAREDGSRGGARKAGVFLPFQPSPAAPGSTESSFDGVNTSSLSRASAEVSLIKGMHPLSAVKICLRRLGLAHTGLEGEKEVEVEGNARLQELVGQVLEHKRVTQVMDDLQERAWEKWFYACPLYEPCAQAPSMMDRDWGALLSSCYLFRFRVTQRRRDKLAESEGRLPLRKVKGARVRDGKRMDGFAGTAGNGVRQGKKKENRRFGSGGDVSLFPGVAGSTAFVSLSGEGPLDGEWAPASSAASGKTFTRAYQGGRRKDKGDSGASEIKAHRLHEPGWAGADREAGWGRGGGRSRNVDRDRRKSTGKVTGKPREISKVWGGSSVGQTKTTEGTGVRGDSGGVGGNRRDPFSTSGKRERGDGDGTHEGEDLHGSWAAKRALKEKEASATKAFSGKKITFNDDDD